MKKIKSLLCVTVFSALIMVGSTVVLANQDYYSFRLPSTGERTTNAVTKTDDNPFKNNVTYVGKQERLDFWGVKEGDSPSNNLTSKAYFTGTGVAWAYYATNTHNGEDIYMTIKTGPTTFTQVDVEGYFAP